MTSVTASESSVTATDVCIKGRQIRPRTLPPMSTEYALSTAPTQCPGIRAMYRFAKTGAAIVAETSPTGTIGW